MAIAHTSVLQPPPSTAAALGSLHLHALALGDSCWVPCSVPAWFLFIAVLKKNMENTLCLPIFPLTIDLQPHGCSSAGTTAPQPAVCRAPLSSQLSWGMCLCSQQPETRILPRTQCNGREKTQQNSHQRSEDPVLLPDTEQSVEDDFAYQWFYSLIPGCWQRRYILWGS